MPFILGVTSVVSRKTVFLSRASWGLSPIHYFLSNICLQFGFEGTLTHDRNTADCG